MNAIERNVRAHVIQALYRTSLAPSAAVTSAALDVPQPQVVEALHSLADQHRLVLLPATDMVWMVHPFSAIATDFVVHAATRKWYANCVWDGLSILGIVGDGWLETHSPETGAPIRFDVRDGVVTADAIVHFLVPASRFWDDIGFTWANILAFRSEDELHAWLAAHAYAQGGMVSAQTVYELGRDWYATRINLDFQPATPDQAQATFARHDPVGGFWSLAR